MEFDGLLALADIVRNSAPGFQKRGIPGVSGVAAIEALVARGVNSFTRFLERLNTSLADSEYIAGEEFSIADITAICIIDFARWANIHIPEHDDHTRRWYDRVSSRPSATA
jgi:glutathione S-transferase